MKMSIWGALVETLKALASFMERLSIAYAAGRPQDIDAEEVHSNAQAAANAAKAVEDLDKSRRKR